MNRKPLEVAKEKDKTAPSKASNLVPNDNLNNANIPINQYTTNMNTFVPPPPGYTIPSYLQWYMY